MEERKVADVEVAHPETGWRAMNVFRYVRHHDIKAYEADGWVVVDDLADTHHGHYAVLMGKVE